MGGADAALAQRRRLSCRGHTRRGGAGPAVNGTDAAAAGRRGPWPALQAAGHAVVPRVPFTVRGTVVGSVARAHLDALREFSTALRVSPERVEALAADPTAALADVNRALHAQGLVRAWRDEIFSVPDPRTLRPLARIERGAARFWGTLTFGAHATGFVRGTDGAVSHLWIAQRSPHKATDPGLFDNLIGGGVPADQTPHEALVREGFEEAGLGPAELRGARAGPVLRLQRDIAEGFQHEWLFSFDLELPAGRVPVNQDGEVAGFSRMSVAEALACAVGRGMTVDAALVTLDFALRHGLLATVADAAAAALQSLRVVPPPSTD